MIDYEAAATNLEIASELAHGDLAKASRDWAQDVGELGRLCPKGKNSSVLAFLGTAILARTVDSEVDVRSINQREGSARPYSARMLAEKVWVPARAKMSVDLGANGPNPFNNSPFFNKDGLEEVTSPKNAEGWSFFLDCLARVEPMSPEDAQLALVGFISARRREVVPQVVLKDELGNSLGLEQAWIAKV
ncbi:MAG: restriction endonuclease, SacI family [Planctomycetota bacterium]